MREAPGKTSSVPSTALGSSPERENINERAAEARAAREFKGLTTGRAKSVLIPTKIEAVRTLRTAGKTIAYIVKNQAMSRASVYRALTETSDSPQLKP